MKKELTTRMRRSQKKKKKPLDPSDSYFLNLQKHIRKLLISGSITSHPFEILTRDFEILILIYLASKNLNILNILSKNAFTITCTNQTLQMRIEQENGNEL